MSSIPDAGRRPPLSRLTVVGLGCAVVLAGLAGGVIGARVVDLGCSGDCTTIAAMAAILGAAFAASGTAIIGVLVARAFTEWDAWKGKTDAAADAD